MVGLLVRPNLREGTSVFRGSANRYRILLCITTHFHILFTGTIKIMDILQIIVILGMTLRQKVV